MYKTEIDRLNKKIEGGKITLSAKRALHNLVEEFFFSKLSEYFQETER